MKCLTEKSKARLRKIRQLLRKKNMTVTEVSQALMLSKQLTTHYVRHLRDLGVVIVVDAKATSPHSTKVTVWGLAEKPKIKKQKPVITPRSNVPTLTRWIGGNPFESCMK